MTAEADRFGVPGPPQFTLLPYLVLYALVWPVLRVVLAILEWRFPRASMGSVARGHARLHPASRRFPADRRVPLLQLHEALTQEGMRRFEGDRVEAERWRAHMNEVLDDVRAYIAKPAAGTVAQESP
jgi:hypothetical protein